MNHDCAIEPGDQAEVSHQFRLFIAGASPRSARARNNLVRVCDDTVPGDYAIEVVDVLDQPDLAEDFSVLATPLVVRVTPLPPRRAVGDFTDLQRLAAAMDLYRLPQEESTT
ncbi:circadian clock KaiB family protein [Nocardioides sp.]|uniref:circadian clock KaiB family protein n=1 Tax=Nocardioides sp. TaxID=35761 RepID=UPI00239256D9|nr:circadian clock KaiB family protein [Nocardioides sp.]MDE0778599.1 circadian clock KaiB family protein [Nocardioides sp.]